MNLLGVLLLGSLAGVVPADDDGLVVLSGNGLHRAEIRRLPGYEGRAPELSRWTVTVRPNVEAPAEGPGADGWSSHLVWNGSPDDFVLADDGRTLAHVQREFQAYRPVMSLLREGRELTAPSGSAFRLGTGALEREPRGTRWLKPDGVPDGTFWLENPDGPVPMLRLEALDGTPCFVALDDGRVWHEADFRARLVVGVEPALEERLREHTRTHRVEAFEVPTAWRAGSPVPVVVDAFHPTQGWRFEAFDLTQAGDQGRELTLEIRSRFPVVPVAEVVVPIRPTARLRRLVPGRYEVRVTGRLTPDAPYRELLVHPADLLVQVERLGPDAATARAFGRGERRVTDGAGTALTWISRAQRTALERALESLASTHDRRRRARVEEPRYRIATWSADGALVVETDDLGLDATTREVVALAFGR